MDRKFSNLFKLFPNLARFYTWHECAAVFVANKALLVDPTYFWFGVPHKQFVLLDDLQTTASYLCSLQKLKLCQIAAKLAPNSAEVQANLIACLIIEQRWKEANATLPAIMRLDPDGWMSYFSQAEIAMHEEKFGAAIGLLHRAITINPYAGNLYFLLGYAYLKCDKLDEARESYRNSLRCILDDKRADQAREAITRINEIERR